MDVWALYYLFVFATGEKYTFEDDRRFPTEQECKEYGAAKGSYVIQEIKRRTPVPVSGGFNCSQLGEDI